MKHYIGPTNPMHAQFDALASYQAAHFAYSFDAGVATLTLNRPERKNPLTFESYAELRNLFRALNSATDVKVVVITGAGGNFCSGGDVHEIIGPLTKMTMPLFLFCARRKMLMSCASTPVWASIIKIQTSDSSMALMALITE